MDILKIIIVSVLGAVVTLIIRQFKPEFVPFVQLSCLIVVFVMICDSIGRVFNSVFDAISESDLVHDEYIFLLIKILSVAVISKIGAEICRDSGSNVLATGVEITAKLVILALCLPLLFSLLDLTAVILG